MTTPGFSSRDITDSFRQFPMRDEAAMSATQPEAGFSNSEAVKDAPQDVHPDGDDNLLHDPGYSNTAEGKVVTEAVTESKTVTPRKSARKKA